MKDVTIMRHGPRSMLGFGIGSVWEGIRKGHRNVVSKIVPGSPAEGELHDGDEIVRIMDQAVDGWHLNAVKELILALENSMVRLTVFRRPASAAPLGWPPAAAHLSALSEREVKTLQRAKIFIGKKVRSFFNSGALITPAQTGSMWARSRFDDQANQAADTRV